MVLSHSQRITFETAQTVTITAVADNVLEVNEAVTLTISAEGGAYDKRSYRCSVFAGNNHSWGSTGSESHIQVRGGQMVTPTAGSIELSEGEALSAGLSLAAAPSGM